LYKQYTNKNKLESGIWFWDLKFPKSSDGLGEPFGVLWFTFDRKIVANPNGELYGILVRSKNMLMGNNNSLTDAIFRNKPDDYIASYRELTQTLQGVYGEMLINSTRFKDNARRDWFKLDSNSIVLRDIIFEFLKRLYIYRTTASRAFSEKKAENTEKNKQKLRDAFMGLTSAPDLKTFVNSFYKAKAKADQEQEEKKREKQQNEEKEREKQENIEKNKLEYADDDVPFLSLPLQKLYNKIIMLLRDFFSKNKDLETFLKARIFIKKGLHKEE
jgi:molecular chaperone HtpG